MASSPRVSKRTATTYDNRRPVFKVLIVGESTVGKTTLLRRYVDGVFLEETKGTIGIDFSLKTLHVNGIECSLQIWDFAGEQKFRALLPKYLMGTDAVIIAFDSSNPRFKRFDEWMDIILNSLKDPIILLISTKNDLESDYDFQDKVDEILSKFSAIQNYFQTSSKTNLNVDQVFKTATNHILQKYNLF